MEKDLIDEAKYEEMKEYIAQNKYLWECDESMNETYGKMSIKTFLNCIKKYESNEKNKPEDTIGNKIWKITRDIGNR